MNDQTDIKTYAVRVRATVHYYREDIEAQTEAAAIAIMHDRWFNGTIQPVDEDSFLVETIDEVPS